MFVGVWRTRRTPTNIRFDPRELVGTYGGLLGTWHCHPTGVATPTPTDLAGAVELRDEHNLKQAIELIAPVGDDAGWARPKLAAWAVYRSPREGRALYERVDV